MSGFAGGVYGAGEESKPPPLRQAQGRLCLSKERRDKDGTPGVGSGEVAISASRGVRSLFEVFPPVQHSRCARRDFSDRTRRGDSAGAGASGGHCESLGGSAKERGGGGEVRRARARCQNESEAGEREVVVRWILIAVG